MATKQNLLSVIVKHSSLEDDTLYQYGRQVLNGSIKEFCGQKIGLIWEVLRKEDENLEMMLALTSKFENKMWDIELVTERRDAIVSLLDLWSQSDRKEEVLKALTDLCCHMDTEAESQKQLFRMIIESGNKQLLEQVSGYNLDRDNSPETENEMLEEILTLKNWKKVLHKVLEDSEAEPKEDNIIPTSAENSEQENNPDDDRETSELDKDENDCWFLEEVFQDQVDPHDDLDDSDDSVTSTEEQKKVLTMEHSLEILKRYRTDRLGKELKDSKDKNFPGMKDNAVQYYKELRKIFGEEVDFERLHYVLNDIVRWKQNWNLNTASKKVSAIGKLLNLMTADEVENFIGKENFKSFQARILREHAYLYEMKQCEEEDQNWSKKELEILKTIKWEDIEERVKQYESKFPPVDEIVNREQLRLMVRLFILRLYIIDHVPRRLEYLQLKWRNYEDGKDNYYVDGTLVLNDYKTYRGHGQYKIGLSTATQSIIEKIIKHRDGQQVDYICGLENQVFESSFRTGRLNEAFEEACGIKNISVNILRKLNIDYKRRRGELEWTTNRQEIARQFGHTETIQERAYKKREREEMISSGSESEDSNVKVRKYRRREEKRKSPRFATEAEEEALKEQVIKWKTEHSGEKYKWSEMRRRSTILKDIPLETVKKWGLRLLKSGDLEPQPKLTIQL